MRCPNCSNKEPLQAGMPCGNCRYTIIFDSKKEEISDKEFRTLTETLQGSGETYFTINQLYTHYLGTGKVSCMTTFFLWIILIVSIPFLANINFIKNTYLGTSIYVNSVLVFLFAGAMTGIFNLKQKAKADKKTFEQFVNRWLKHYPIANLITAPTLQEAPPNSFSEDDLYDYGVEAIIVVDQDIYVDLFVKNNYLNEWKSVIISQNAYPHYLVEKVQQILDDNPTTPIKYLHNSRSNMYNMRKNLSNFLNLPNTIEEIDLGLHPSDRNSLDIFKQRSGEANGLQLDFLPPARLAQTMGVAILGGLLIGAVLKNHNSNQSGGDFG